MAKKKNRRETEGATMDMSPMIDVVFQLIIFFVVTLKTADTINPDIVLEYGKNGPTLEADKFKVPPLTIEVKRYFAHTKFFNGALNRSIVSINGAILSDNKLRDILKQTVARRGKNFPLLIRADKDAYHEDVRRVMNICNEVGIWQVSFLAMKVPGDSANKAK